jgi:hypothetical protein
MIEARDRNIGLSTTRKSGRHSLAAAMRDMGIENLSRDWLKIPLVGHSERGDRAELERVMVGQFPLTQSQATIITREFPVGDPWHTMSLNLRGELLAGGAPTGTIKADAPLQLYQVALTTDLDKDVVEPQVSARPLFRYAQFIEETAGDLVAPTVPGAGLTTSFNANVLLIFSDPRLLIPEDSILDTRRYNTITLTIFTGSITDIVTTPVQLTLQNTFVDIEVLRVSPRVPLPLNVVKVLPFYKRYAPLVPPNDTILNLDRVPTLAMKRLLWFSSAGTDVIAGVPFTGGGVDTVIDTFRISSNRRDHFGSAVGGVSRRVLRGDNKLDYKVETYPSGWSTADITLDKSLNSALATGDLSVLQSILTYQGGLPATPQVSVFQAGVQKLRGTRGR